MARRWISFLVALSCAVAAVGVAIAATSPKALRKAIVKAALAKHSVHYVTVSSGRGIRITMVSDVADRRGIQRVKFSRNGKTGHATTLLVNATVYIRGDKFALHAYMAFPAALASRYAGRWLSISNTSSLYHAAARDVTLSSFIKDGVPQHHLSLASGTIAGKKLRGLRGTAPEGGILTLYVLRGATPLPVEGKEVVPGAQPLTSRVRMSDWNEPVGVHAPAHAIPLPAA